MGETKEREERELLERKLRLAKDEVKVWQGPTKDWMSREKKERQRKDHVAFLLEEAYGTIEELKKKMSGLEEELLKRRKNDEELLEEVEREEDVEDPLPNREQLLNEVVDLDDDVLMDQALMRDIEEKCSTPDDVLLNTTDSVLLAES